MMDKRSRRRECLTLLKSLSPAEKETFSNTIADLLASSSEFRGAKTILAYSALPTEPDLRRLILSHPEKRWAFPKIIGGEKLSFFLADSMNGLIPGQFGIQEPDPTLHRPVFYPEVDLILVPGLGFDPDNGSRLGRGRGYYDKFLGAHYRKLHCVPGPLVVGVCFSIQFSPLETESHDFPMHRIVSELGWNAPGVSCLTFPVSAE